MRFQTDGHRLGLRSCQHERWILIRAGEPAGNGMTVALDQLVTASRIVEEHVGILATGEGLAVVGEHHEVVPVLAEAASKIVETRQIDLVVVVARSVVASVVRVNGVRVDEPAPVEEAARTRRALRRVDDTWLPAPAFFGLVGVFSTTAQRKEDENERRT